MRTTGSLLLLGLSLLATYPASAQEDEAASPDADAPAAEAPADAEAPAAEAPADAAPQTERLRVLVLDLTDTGALGPNVVSTITGRIVVTLADVPSLDIVSGDDVRRLAELEADRQTIGCDEASCLAELAGALGARYVVFGQVGRLGELLIVNLSLFDSEEAQSVGRASAEASNLESLPGAIGPALRKLLAGVVSEADLAALPSEAPPIATAGSAGGGFPVLPAAIAGAGGLVLVAGVGLVVGAFVPGVLISNAEGRLGEDREKAISDAQELRATWFDSGAASGMLYGGAGLAVVGLGLLGGGGAWAVMGTGE